MILVVGYGNELRRDDSLGPRLAREVASWNLPGVRAIEAHQLTPELIDDLRQATAVLFVDARVDGGEAMSIRVLWPSDGETIDGHLSRPSSLLALCRVLHGRAPVAWLLTVAAHDLSHGFGLSPQGEENFATALGDVRLWISARGETARGSLT